MAKRKSESGVQSLRNDYLLKKRLYLQAGRRLGEATNVHKKRTGVAMERVRFAGLRRSPEGDKQIERELEAIYSLPQQKKARARKGYWTPKAAKSKRNALRVKMFAAFLGSEQGPVAVANLRRRRPEFFRTK